MKRILRRNGLAPRRVEDRRLVAMAVIMMALSGLWHTVRPEITRVAAGLSLGWPGRGKLVRAVLRRKMESHPEFGYTPGAYVSTNATPGRGQVGWNEYTKVNRRLRTSAPSPYGFIRHFADHTFRYRGKLRVVLNNVLVGPNDMDGDGAWELVLAPRGFLIPSEPPRIRRTTLIRARPFGVIRLGHRFNEIVWAGMANEEQLGPPGTQVVPICRDEDGDGTVELVFVTKERRASPLRGFEPPRTLAVFEWDRPGGVLRARFVAPESGLITWVDPERLPVRYERTRPADNVIRDLLLDPEALIPADQLPR